ncbi:alpha/beta hydrolase family protein [Sphaerisporangium perillae]|uniref:alpha/beta hydrolase family protein n=1 Tax=Sphaerisporangium perillae TaxID=2935860 RepID=UPI00200CF662|nr:alpha/beta hydrolase [Sphaerisporangium perillae]
MRAIAGLAALVMVLGACGGEGGTASSDRAAVTPSAPATPTPVTSPPAPASSPAATPTTRPVSKGPNLSGCYTKADGKIFTYGKEDLPGVVMGKGSTGAVISYERGGNACTWRPLADRLVSSGYRVLLYARDLVAIPSDNIAAMAKRLGKERGVKRLFLVGGSVGGLMSVTAALELDGEVAIAGVVDLAGPPDPAETARLTVPLLQITAENDGRVPQGMKTAHDAATRAPDRQFVVIEGESSHASWLFDTPHGPQVLDTITTFMDRHRA